VAHGHQRQIRVRTCSRAASGSRRWGSSSSRRVPSRRPVSLVLAPSTYPAPDRHRVHHRQLDHHCRIALDDLGDAVLAQRRTRYRGNKRSDAKTRVTHTNGRRDINAPRKWFETPRFSKGSRDLLGRRRAKERRKGWIEDAREQKKVASSARASGKPSIRGDEH